ncbi:lysoplasmalogenase [Microbacterium caowuchunii]|nr:lysoplasmalogenase [Microbacterium caowuchunii]
MRTVAEPETVTTLTTSWWWGFAVFAAAAVVHILALALDAGDVARPTKLLLMPLLVLAALWAWRGTRRGAIPVALVIALILSWFGDGAATFFPFAPELPMMLLCFGLAHVVYIWLFLTRLARRRVPMWALVYAAWWLVLVIVLWPHLGGLAFAVAAYGLVLAGTATAAARCGGVIALGGAFFLASDTVLAFRLFLPDAMPDWTSPLVMLTYCLGQALIAAGVVLATSTRVTTT